jgi:hypothetical protein
MEYDDDNDEPDDNKNCILAFHPSIPFKKR